MFQTTILLKLETEKIASGGVVGGDSRLISLSNNNKSSVKVKLSRQIQGAKYLEVFSDLDYVNASLGFRCDLTDETRCYRNFESISSGKVLDKVIGSTILLLSKRSGYERLIPISPSRSVIDEFVIDVFPLLGKGMTESDAKQSFIQIIIHHTEY